MGIRQIFSFTVLLVLIAFMLAACSRNSKDAANPVIPESPELQHNPQSYGHIPLGYYGVAIDLKNGTIDAIPARGAEFHLNVLPFMEPPLLEYLSINWSSLVVDTVNNKVEVDVIFTHPFSNLNEFMGFDVKGIVITDGSLGGFSDTGVIIPKATEPRLVNADGYARWWNPNEFTGSGIFGYEDGLLGAPDSYAQYGSTVNGYKYFADGLGKDASVLALNTSLRGRFSAGAKITRHYVLSFGDSTADFMMFNYAVDASWAAPAHVPPSGMEDFPPEANQPEAFAVAVAELENTFWYSEPTGTSGGHASLCIDVMDWQGLSSVASVHVEAPELFSGFKTCTPDPANNPDDIHGKYYVTIDGQPPNDDGIQVLVTVENISGDFSQGGMNVFTGPSGILLAAYNVYTADVAANTIPTVGPVTGEEEPICGECYIYSVAAYDYEDSAEELTYEWIITPPSGPSDYDLDICPDDGDPATLDIVFLKNGTFTIDVKVTDTDGGYAYSSKAAKPNAKYGPAPDPVGNVVITVNRDEPIETIENVTLSWAPVPGANQYAVYWTEDPYTPGQFLFQGVTDTTSYMINPMDKNTAYLFTVRSRAIPDNPDTESGDSEYAYAEFETADDEDIYRWVAGYRVYGDSDRFERVTGAGSMAGQKGWRMDVTDMYIQGYSWSVIASPPIPVFDNTSTYRIEFLRHHVNPFNYHGLSVGTTDEIYSSANDTFPNFDTSMFWVEGEPYTGATCAAIQQKFVEPANNSGAFWDYCSLFTYSAFELPKMADLIAAGKQARAAIGYAGYYTQMYARVELDDISVVVY